MFSFLCAPNADELVVSDFELYFETRKEAEKAFLVFDTDANGSISKQELATTVQNVFLERRHLSTSLIDAVNALAKLNQIMISFVVFISIFIWLSLFEVNITLGNTKILL